METYHRKKKKGKNQIKPLLLSMRYFLCIFVAGITLFAYIDKQNELTELRLAIPALMQKVKAIQEENTQLTYEIERFENPIHLMELMRKPELGHLKYPYLKDEIFLPRKRHIALENYSSLPSERYLPLGEK